MKRNHAIRIMAVVLGISTAAVKFYSIRELAAALLLFSVLFGIIGTGLLILIATEKLALKGMALLEPGVAYIRARTRAASLHRSRNVLIRNPR